MVSSVLTQLRRHGSFGYFRNWKTASTIALFFQFQQWAQDLDKLASVKGPFHGLPIAVSDEHNVEGMDTTLGLGKRLLNPANRSSVLVQTLLSMGMIPFVKTNVPQALFSIGSDNPLFGTTANGLNPTLSPGGGNSGAAALVATGGAILAVGTDFFGSLRIPAHLHGLAAIKCTQGRISDRGVQSSLPNLIGSMNQLYIDYLFSYVT